ncbi:unnamed protein product [Sphagnum troendelagicum]|uniref:X8 domain-containing protein n=1 Tax=Sphagnum troendelagicum TaxID=128251 RepID=A0ABP0TWN0_9BRYO
MGRIPAARRGAAAKAVPEVHLLVRILCICALLYNAGASVGVNYGTLGDNLPTPTQAVELLKEQGITQVRIFDTNPAVLQAFQGSSIQLIVGVLNSELITIAQSNDSATTWVKEKVLPFAATCNITCIAVGNEVLTTTTTTMTTAAMMGDGDPATNLSATDLSLALLPAITFIQAALVFLNLENAIKVSTPFSTDLLTSTFPPSTGEFNSSFSTTIVEPLLNFLSETSSFLMLNVYPYKAYEQNPQTITLDFALFLPNSGVLDSGNGFLYSNAFDALLDAAYIAMAALNHTDLVIVVSETGWPSLGDPNQLGLSSSNAQTYNSNVLKHVLNKTGTPVRPGVEIVTYLYELFNEDKELGASSARNFGLFHADMSPVYPIDLSGASETALAPPLNPALMNHSWCIAKQGVNESSLQADIDYACGLGGANCLPIQPGMLCYLPNTRFSHASYAINSYYQKNTNAPEACDFEGTATITTTDPSYGNCTYPSSTQMAAGPKSGSSLLLHVEVPHLLCSMLLVLLMLNPR